MDVHSLNKFSICVDIVDESVAEALPPEIGESNHIPVKPTSVSCHSDEAEQNISVGNIGADFEKVRTTRMNDSELFIVKQLDEIHTCSIEIIQGHHRQASSWMIGECVKVKFVDLTSTSYQPSEVMRDMQGEFEVSFNYLRAWRGKEAALHNLCGDDAESYQVLPSWGEMVMKKNHGPDIHIKTYAEDRLKYFYMCLVALKQGWPHCRPVIIVDASALKARFGGTLLAACGHDANGSIFPIAFCIKNNDLWEWFFTKLRESIDMRDELAIVADRHKSIKYVVMKVYPEADFGICVQHLAGNLKAKFKSFNSTMKTYFNGALRTYLRSEFFCQMGFIEKGNPTIHRYLMDAYPVKWSRTFFNGRQYTIMTTNITESLNNVDRKARLMPVGIVNYKNKIYLEKLENQILLEKRDCVTQTNVYELLSPSSLSSYVFDHAKFDLEIDNADDCNLESVICRIEVIH
ncbi:uncharacterized protein LOC112092958 [Morus notabilis]|uniref:uncharacterized protein LOC112092958 n=1 Tax=Morus notabilis TaxID=981085 RepID=UPI000CED16B1|nr:uncharacterized protein LOC112092958 [Morus notabilis]